MTDPSLFRKEALEHQKLKWTGKALLISGLSPLWVAALSLAFLLGLLIFVIGGSYTHRVNVSGEVVTQPHAINLYAPQQGFIAKIFVTIGSKVRKGQPLYLLDIDRATNTGYLSSRSAELIQRQLNKLESIVATTQEDKRRTLENLQQQLAFYQKNLKQSRSMAEMAHKGVDFMRSNMKDYTAYQRRGLITKDQTANQSYMYYQQEFSYQNLYSQAMQDELQITNLQSQLVTRAAELDNQIAQYEYQRESLQRQLTETEAKGTIMINAPAAGRVESLSVTLGQMVNAGDSLAQLSPGSENSYRLVLWLPNNSAPYVHSNELVNIRYDAFPFEKFGQFSGRIESVSSIPASPQEMSTYSNKPSTQDTHNDSYYKVIVKPAQTRFTYQQQQLVLSTGMRAQATLFLERRPLYQWMLAPFYNIRKSVTGPIHE